MKPRALSESKVLITQGHLVRYMGSEVVTLELAEFLSDAGAEVVVATQAYGYPLRKEFERRGIRVLEISDPELDRDLRDRRPDVAWIQHSVIPRALLERPDETAFFFHHMSSFLAPEFTLDSGLERQLATAVLFESRSSLERHVATGLYDGIDSGRLQVMGNPAPARFAEAVRPDEIPRRITVVSNHIPSELAAALVILEEEYEVERIGSQRELGASPKRVDVDDIGGTGAVVSIGKTVQYALTVGTPVYCYDHFGGPGWVTMENLEHTAFHNFSGRDTSRKSAEELADDLRIGFDVMQGLALEIRDAMRTRFALPGRWEELEAWAIEHPLAVTPPMSKEIVAHQAVQDAIGTYIREWVRMQADATHNAALAAAFEQERAHAVEELQRIHANRAYRFAQRVQKVKNMVRTLISRR